jgi:lipopolysaccharide transport system permease protein
VISAGHQVVRIRPSKAWVPLRLGELWEFRELLYFLIWRDIKVRYKQTALGVAWAVVQPLLTMVVFSVFFGRLGGLPSDGLPYPVFAFCALLPWQLFAFALSETSNSVVANQRLLTKVYFPRLVMPIAALGVGLIDFAVGCGVLAGLMIYYGLVPGWAIWTIPMWTSFGVLTALAAGLWLSALNVKYRDVRYVVPFLSQLWMFATPIAYSTALVPERWRTLYAINPMVGVVDGFRWALLGTATGPGVTTLVSAAVVAVVLASGLYYFRRMERTFADIV